MAGNNPDLLLEEAFRGSPAEGRMPIVDAPRIEPPNPPEGFDWRPAMLLVTMGGAILLAAAYLF